MNNWEAYFGTPERTAITLSDAVYHSQMCSMSGNGTVPTFDVTAECVMPSLRISNINPGTSISDWLESEICNDLQTYFTKVQRLNYRPSNTKVKFDGDIGAR